MEEVSLKDDLKLHYTKDFQHNNLVFCNFCKKRFNILNIKGHIKREKEKLTENVILINNDNDAESKLHVKYD